MTQASGTTIDGATALDVVVPVYNEGANIIGALRGLQQNLKLKYRVLICYDRDDDDTLEAVRDHPDLLAKVLFVKNAGRGAHGAVMTGFAQSTAPYVVVFAADDHLNAGILEAMVETARHGADIVCASRFIPGGSMTGCPIVKDVLVRGASFTLHYFARLPTHDASNGFRLFSRRVIDEIVVESDRGFTFSLELTAKAHRLGWRIGEVPARWQERSAGASRFRVIDWLPYYLRWYAYVFATAWLRRGPETVPLRQKELLSRDLLSRDLHQRDLHERDMRS